MSVLGLRDLSASGLLKVFVHFLDFAKDSSAIRTCLFQDSEICLLRDFLKDLVKLPTAYSLRFLQQLSFSFYALDATRPCAVIFEISYAAIFLKISYAVIFEK